MNFKSFLDRYNGKYNVGNTTENKGECVGLVSVFIDSLNLPHVWGNASDLFANADEKFFEKILNTPDAIPQAGDIIVWNSKFNGTVGHTGIATGTASLDTFECFEQNDPLKSNCHLKTYKYTYVTGWLRPKILASPDNTIQTRADAFVAVASELNKPVDKDIVLADIRHFKELEDKLRQSNTALDEANSKLIQIQLDANVSQNKVDELVKENTSLQVSLQALTDATKIQAEELMKLQVKVSELQAIQPVSKTSVSDLIKEIFSRFKR